MRKLEGLGRLVMGFDVPDEIFYESFSFETRPSSNVDLYMYRT